MHHYRRVLAGNCAEYPQRAEGKLQSYGQCRDRSPIGSIDLGPFADEALVESRQHGVDPGHQARGTTSRSSDARCARRRGAPPIGSPPTELYCPLPGVGGGSSRP